MVYIPQFSTPKHRIYLSPSHTCYMTCLFGSSSFDHLNNILSVARVIDLFLMYSSLLLFYFVLLRPKCRPQQPILQHYQAVFLPPCERPNSTPGIFWRLLSTLLKSIGFRLSYGSTSLGWQPPSSLVSRSLRFHPYAIP